MVSELYLISGFLFYLIYVGFNEFMILLSLFQFFIFCIFWFWLLVFCVSWFSRKKKLKYFEQYKKCKTKTDIECFDGKEGFNIWRKKMHVVLVYQKYARAFGREGVLPETMSTTDKVEVMEIAYSLLILHISNNVLGQIDEKNITAKVSLKLEFLYMTKSLTNKIYLKEQLFGFNMDPAKSLDDNLNEFKKITVSLANIEVKISKENQPIIILNSLHESFKDVKTAIKYGKESLTQDDVFRCFKIKGFRNEI